jgi:SOS-response transcriptional repressor LexA
MCDIGQRIKHLRNSHDLSQTQLAELLGYKNYTTVTKWEKGENLPRGKELKMMAEYFKVSTDYILGLTNDILPNKEENDLLSIYTQLEPPRQKKVYSYAEKELEDQNKVVSFPVYGKTAAGTDPVTYGDPDVEHQDFSNVPAGADIALNVTGDSMEPLISDGSIVFYKSQPTVENGEIAIVEIEGDGVTCKRVKFDYENEKIILQSENDKYEDMVFDNNQIRILGKVLL